MNGWINRWVSENKWMNDGSDEKLIDYNTSICQWININKCDGCYTGKQYSIPPPP